jgi:hypothetical protein
MSTIALLCAFSILGNSPRRPVSLGVGAAKASSRTTRRVRRYGAIAWHGRADPRSCLRPRDAPRQIRVDDRGNPFRDIVVLTHAADLQKAADDPADEE